MTIIGDGRGKTNGRRRWARAAPACALFLASILGAAGAAANPLDLYYERALMSAANSRCGLFDPTLAFALASAQAQAKGAALRSGAGEAAVARVSANAQSKAGAVACGSPDLALAARRVREAFTGYSRLQRMTFTGDLADWQAHRLVSPEAVRWRLSQAAGFGRDRAMFGLAGQGPSQQVAASAVFADGAWPYTARLVTRDAARSPPPSDHNLKAGTPLARRAPQRPRATVLVADGRSLAEPAMLPGQARSGVLFRFPAAASGLLQGLDPREAVAVEFVFAGREREHDTVRTAYFEVGDFVAGEAFLKVAAR